MGTDFFQRARKTINAARDRDRESGTVRGGGFWHKNGTAAHE